MQVKEKLDKETLDRYESITRKNYRNDLKARSYYRSYAGMVTPANLYAKAIAAREVACVRRLLDDIGLQSPSCLDVPCGTGKLAKLLCSRASMVVGADISAEMMSFAVTYKTSPNSWLVQADAQQMPFADKEFDLVLCLRLFHRVPKQLRLEMMSEFKRVSSAGVIVSMAIEGPWQRMKWRTRRVLRMTESAPFAANLHSFRDEVETSGFAWRRSLSVMPGLSSERLFLLSPVK